MNLSRRTLLGTVPVAALVATACSGGGGNGPDTGSSATNDGILTVSDGGPSYPKNFNWYGANEQGTAPGLNLVYESPFLLDYTKPGNLVPRLAESYEMEDDGKTMVFHLRKGVKWSDGTEMTAADFVYTLSFVNGEACADPDKCWSVKPPEAIDDYTCKVYFHTQEYQQMSNYALYYPIYPAHIWKDRERKTDINENPVGTGPFTVKSFDPQQVVYELRSDYWGEKSQGVKQIKFVPTGPVGGVQSQLDRGTLDVAELAAPGVEADFVAKNPDKNHFSVYSSGGSIILPFNCSRLPFSDVAVRKAFRDSLDMKAILDLGKMGQLPASVTGLDPALYKDSIKPEYAKPMTVDVAGAKKSLADAGWTVDGGVLTKDGKKYPLDLYIDNGNANNMQMGQVLIDQWKKSIGVAVTWRPTPTQVFNDSGTEGKYDLWISGAIPGGNYYIGYNQFAKSLLVPVGTKEGVYGNAGRWDDKQIQAAIETMRATRSDEFDKLLPAYQEIQTAVANGAPFIPLYLNATSVMWSSRKWTGMPAVASTNFKPGIGGLNTGIMTVLSLKPA